MKDDFTDADAWVHPIKIVEHKASISVSMILQVHTSFSTCKLYQDAKEIYQKYQIRVVSKEIDMEHAKRIGTICGAYVKLASNMKYASMISNETNLLKNNIEIRKRNVYKKNAKSKILVVHAIESKADDMNAKLLKMKNPMFKCLSFRNSRAESRIAALHSN